MAHCFACEHHCIIHDGAVGICHVRKNQGGKLYSLVYGKLVAQHVDPIEKKPLAHFLPGSLAYSIATVGCNFKCKNCQNADISQVADKFDSEDWIPGARSRPEEVVAAAREAGCRSVAYTYTEPTVFIEFALDTMKLSRQSGLKNVWVSNGYFSEQAFALIKPYLDAINIDLKFFSEQTYKAVCGAKMSPVLKTIRRLIENKIHTEITTLIIPGLNDGEQELRQMARFLADLDQDVAWHVSAFHPAYQMRDYPPTPLSTLQRARKIGWESGLKNVYLGNV